MGAGAKNRRESGLKLDSKKGCSEVDLSPPCFHFMTCALSTHTSHGIPTLSTWVLPLRSCHPSSVCSGMLFWELMTQLDPAFISGLSCCHSNCGGGAESGRG